MDNTVLAVSYYTNGVNFQISAERLRATIELDADRRPQKLTAIPLYFLASHAAELFLKAALLKRGFPECDTRKFEYRHNLEALLHELQQKTVPVSENTKAVIAGLSDQHKHHVLRYSVLHGEDKTYWPPLDLVFEALDELLMLTRLSTHGV